MAGCCEVTWLTGEWEDVVDTPSFLARLLKSALLN